MPSNSIDPKFIIDTLRKFGEQIPDFTQLSNQQKISLRKAATLDPNWITEAVTLVGASDAVQTGIGSTAEELHQEIADQGLWFSVELEAKAFLRGVMSANTVRRHRLGLKALQAYGIGRQLIRRPEHSHLATFVNTLKQMNKLGPRKKKPEDAEE